MEERQPSVFGDSLFDLDDFYIDDDGLVSSASILYSGFLPCQGNFYISGKFRGINFKAESVRQMPGIQAHFNIIKEISRNFYRPIKNFENHRIIHNI